MEIRLDQLKDRPWHLVLTEPVGGFPALHELAEQGMLLFHGGIDINLRACLAGQLVEVDGTLGCSLEVPCSRCLQPVVQRLELTVALTFTRHAAGEQTADAERELTEDEVGLITFDGDFIDLRSPLEQELLMALPQHSLCRDDCAGLCPYCGTDLNRRSCSCGPPQFHGGLAALRNFKVAKD